MPERVAVEAKGLGGGHYAFAPPITPPCFDATPTTILTETTRLIEASKRVQDAIVQLVDSGKATFDNTILPMMHEENEMLYKRQLIEFYAHVSPSEETRQASRSAKRLFAEFDTETSTRQDIYDLILAVHSRAESLDSESRHLVEKLLLESRRQGLAATPEHRRRLHEIDTELGLIESQFLDALQLPQDSGIWIGRTELEGVPERFKNGSRDEGSGSAEVVQLKVEGRMQLLDLLSYVEDHKAREKIYREFVGLHQSNAGLFEKAIVLRREKAQILGYTTYAEWSMAARMEKDPDNVEVFLRDLSKSIKPMRDSIVGEWRRMKQEDLETLGKPDDGKFYIWDRPYYTRLMMEQKYSFDSDEIKEYFPLEHTVSCMLGIFGHLFGLRFVNTTGHTNHDSATDTKSRTTIWHEDVLLYAVWDNSHDDQENPEFLGYMYMDLYCRPGKRPGFADLLIRPGLSREDGSRSFPSTGLVCNFEKPSQDEPCLLQHDHVVLLFHELGHGIHDLVAKTHYARFHGASTAPDFNEAPSQMLENWCWLAEVLQIMSKRCKNSTPGNEMIEQLGLDERSAEMIDESSTLPDDLIKRLVSSKRAKNVLQCLALLGMSLFDASIDQALTDSDAKNVDTTLLYHGAMAATFGFDVPEDPPPSHTVEASHFTIDGIYIYLTSQLYAMDMFRTAFNRDPMSCTEGLRYRRMVLEKGSSQDEMEFLSEFLGRRPNVCALQSELQDFR